MTYLFDKVASVTDCRSTGHFVLPKRKVEVCICNPCWVNVFVLIHCFLDFFGFNCTLMLEKSSYCSDKLKKITDFH